MACFHPLLGLIVGINPITGKNNIKVMPYDEEKVNLWKKNNINFVELPCGHCIGCRLEYSRQWANRLMLELQYHDSAYFITLTYSDDFLPRNPVTDENGVYLYDSFSLKKKHLSQFIKHLRKHFPNDKIRFFGVGEYGSSSCRPHYHIIVFGLHLDDLQLYKRNPQGDRLYISKSVNECWSNFIGFDSNHVARYDQIGWCVVAPVTWETCAYTARYVTKKMTGDLGKYFENNNMEFPFSLMSRRPGIAFQWYKDHPNWIDNDYINVPDIKKPRKFRPPRYFDKLLENDLPEVYETRKFDRSEFCKKTREVLESHLEKSYLEYLADKEFNLKNRLKKLDRTKV